jgi:hypothetical protein
MAPAPGGRRPAARTQPPSHTADRTRSPGTPAGPLIRADRRVRPPVGRDPLLDLGRRPLPGPGHGELPEPADQTDPPPSVNGPVSRRACCWRRYPSSISSNSAGPSEKGASPSVVTSASPPRRFPTQYPVVTPDASFGYPAQQNPGQHPGICCTRPPGTPAAPACRAHAAPIRQAGPETQALRPAITLSGECCIRCNSAHLPGVAEGVPELVRGPEIPLEFSERRLAVG